MLAVSGGGGVRVFHVEQGVTTTISDLTISGGLATNGGGTVATAAFGGGLLNVGGTVTLTGVAV